MLQVLKERSKKRRELLAQQLGVDNVEDLSSVLGNREERSQVKATKKSVDEDLGSTSRVVSSLCSRPWTEGEKGNEVRGPEAGGSGGGSDVSTVSKKCRTDSTGTGKGREERESGHHPKKDRERDRDREREPEKEEGISTYTDSSTFLKGTQSANPHNDYCQHFVDTGHRPQNFIRDVGLADRFEEYPKLKELIKLKDELIMKTATPPMYLKCDLKDLDLRELKCKFDVILVEPPLEEYQRTHGVTNTNFWSWEEIMSLPVEEVAAQRGFLFLWCGSSDGLDLGRQCLRKWGFRRCEDICWIKTNIKNPGHSKNLEPKAICQRTKEHCLMGIKGTVRRSTDGDFIHANVDIDLIISDDTEYGKMDKPEEIFHIIEHFCLGRRRLHVFGRDTSIRPGWLTLGPGLTNSNFNAETYSSYFDGQNGHLTGCTERIESLRPKSPPPKNKGQQQGRGGGGSRGGGGGPSGGNRPAGGRSQPNTRR